MFEVAPSQPVDSTCSVKAGVLLSSRLQQTPERLCGAAEGGIIIRVETNTPQKWLLLRHVAQLAGEMHPSCFVCRPWSPWDLRHLAAAGGADSCTEAAGCFGEGSFLHCVISSRVFFLRK